MKKLLFFALTASFFLSGCNDDDTPGTPVYKGAEQTLGNGKVYSWVKFSDNIPTSIGFTLTKGALDNLPHGGVALVLSLPAEAVGKTPFDHIMLDYLHTGHEPPGTYDVAHFDMHFYVQPLAERKAIPVYSAASATKFDNLPPTGHIPAGYIRLPAGVPEMGVHWVDPTSPELSGKGKFTETLIYGSYDGKMTFIEPMVTYDFLKGQPNLTKALPLPTKFAKSGYYPMKYSIKQAGDEIQVSLDDLMMMQ